MMVQSEGGYAVYPSTDNMLAGSCKDVEIHKLLSLITTRGEHRDGVVYILVL